MKKLNILASLCTGLLLLTACESDRDSNPTVKMPEGFTLYESVNASNPIALEQSDKMYFSVKEQPDYGYTAMVNYQVQVSLDDKWNDATADTKLHTLQWKIFLLQWMLKLAPRELLRLLAC